MYFNFTDIFRFHFSNIQNLFIQIISGSTSKNKCILLYTSTRGKGSFIELYNQLERVPTRKRYLYWAINILSCDCTHLRHSLMAYVQHKTVQSWKSFIFLFWVWSRIFLEFAMRQWVMPNACVYPSNRDHSILWINYNGSYNHKRQHTQLQKKHMFYRSLISTLKTLSYGSL